MAELAAVPQGLLREAVAAGDAGDYVEDFLLQTERQWAPLGN